MARLESLIDRLDDVTKNARSEFGSLSAAQLNWKPNPEAWSVGLCLDHLITSNSTYFPMLEQIAEGKRRGRLWERMPILPGLFGKMLKEATGPEVKRKAQSPTNFRPTQSAVHPTIVDDFAEHQQKLAALMRRTEGLDHESIIVTSPAASFVIYSLADCYEILTGHEERHLNQARRVVERPEFPRL